MTELVWIIGGEAGYGILSSGEMFSQIIKEHGFYVFSTTEYPSLIRGGHNNFTVRANDKPINAHVSSIDLLVALDELTIKKHHSRLSINGAIICDEGINPKVRSDVKVCKIPLDKLASGYGELKKVIMATIGIGASAKLVGMDFDIISKMINKRFKKKGKNVIEQNIKALTEGYNSITNADFKIRLSVKPKKKDMMLIEGNTSIALGAIRAGCKFMSSYPMTPATSIMEYKSKHHEDQSIIMHQAEDEISAINIALGASYAGVRSMVATSGGGFALMNESLSLAGCSETPIVIVLGQRPGPATGLPTRTEQGDLLYTIHAGHGEFPRVILAPGDVNECFSMTLEAFNLADRFQIPVIILTDKYLGVSLSMVPEFKSDDYKIDRGELITKVGEKLKPNEKFKRYKITNSGVSPRTIPSVVNGMQLSIGDEHDEEGYIVEEPVDRKLMVDKRNQKNNGIVKALRNDCVSVHGRRDSRKVIVSWGSNKGIILEAMKSLPEIKFVQLKVMHPFPAEELKEKIGNHDKLILIEQNLSGQLGSLIKKNTELKVTDELLKYDGRPFDPEEIIKFVRRVN